jgi:tetratricopeptide (TPR) repeat protein
MGEPKHIVLLKVLRREVSALIFIFKAVFTSLSSYLPFSQYLIVISHFLRHPRRRFRQSVWDPAPRKIALNEDTGFPITTFGNDVVNFKCVPKLSPSPVKRDTFFGRGRRALLTLALVAPAVFFPCSLAQAAGEPAEFLQWGAGARSLAMGRAFLAVSDDASATYWNPAAMTQIKQKEIMGLQAAMFEGTSYSFFSYVSPSSKAGVWGINMTRLGSAGFKKVSVKLDPSSTPGNPQFLSVEDLGSFNVAQSATTLAYGKQVTKQLSMGFSAKKISNTVDTFSQSFTAIDASIFSQVNENYRFAAAIRNAVTQAPSGSDDRLPMIIRVGNAYSMLNKKLTLSADLNSSRYSGFGWNVGGEYWSSKRMALRMGIESRGGVISESTAGLGFRFGRMGLDMAFGLSELGMAQRISMSWKFGKDTETGRDEEIKKLIAAGKNAFNKGNYAQALARLEGALSIDPSNKGLSEMVTKMQSIVGSVPAATGDGETDRLVRQGVASYVAGDLQTAYDSLRTAFEKNPSNQRLMDFTNNVARKAGQPLVEPSRSGVSGARWTLVDQKLHEALQSIYEGRYDVAITKCEQVLRIDPSNVTAIGRMGASFFLMGEKDKAINLWKRALELEPNNQTAIDYLKQLGAYDR